jgi:uncharacterized protein (TIGR03435 family)
MPMTLRRLLAIVGAPALFAVILSAQAPVGPAFDVASIKPDTSGPRGISNIFLSGGRYVGSAATVRGMIGFAYQPLLGRQIVGGPAWLDSERFEIQAKANRNPSVDMLRLMLQSLLADRFKLRVHMEKRESPAYLLVLARTDGKLGAQVRPGTVDCSDHRADAPPPDSTAPAAPPVECSFRIATRFAAGAGMQIIQTGKGVTMAQLAGQLSTSSPVGRLVIDRTGLPGAYDVDLSFAAGSPGDTPGAASIFTALQEQLGLKLESMTAPVDFLVIDSADHPSQN